MDSMIEEQFTAMYRCHRVAVERYVLRRVQAEDVGDVLAEVFLTAWRRYEQIPADPLPWLYGVLGGCWPMTAVLRGGAGT